MTGRTVRASKANIGGTSTGGQGRATVVEVKASGRRPQSQAYVSTAALEKACADAARQGGVERYTDDCDPAAAYVKLMRVYESWQRSHLKGKDAPESLRAELTAAGLVSRHLFRQAILIKDNKPVNEYIGGQKPCDVLSMHVNTATRLISGSDPSSPDGAETRLLLRNLDTIAFISRMLLRNCGCHNLVARFGKAVHDVVSEDGVSRYVQLSPADVRSDALPMHMEMVHMRGPCRT